METDHRGSTEVPWEPESICVIVQYGQTLLHELFCDATYFTDMVFF